MTAHYLGPWRVDVDVRPEVERPIPVYRTTLVRAIARALEAGGAPEPASIGLILSGDRELAALNETHLGHEGATDVLSFPLLPPSAFPPHEGSSPDAAAPASGGGPIFIAGPPGRRTNLGDIVLSVERAIEQAQAGRGGQTGDVHWSARDELRLLVTHGALHVCGWDHAEPAEERAMRALEQRLLAED
jgi:probable rRNA maturation factor